MLRRYATSGWLSISTYFLLNRTKYNLNSISHDSAIGLIDKLTSRGVNIVEVQ